MPPRLAALLEEVAIAEDEDFDDDDAAVRNRKEPEHRGRPISMRIRWFSDVFRAFFARFRGDRTKFGLFLRSYMKLAGYIDGQDFPLALDLEDVQQVRFTFSQVDLEDPLKTCAFKGFSGLFEGFLKDFERFFALF